MAVLYDPKKIESKWQKVWAMRETRKKSLSKGKFYVLDMFPYPSGDGLHVGHVENFTATDIYARFLRLQGYEVLHPIGWDAFGLPAENFAIKTGIHPEKRTKQSIKNFTRQIKSIGLSYDWECEINTSSPEYYRWTQWMFLFFYKHGLAYKKKAKVNWCPSCQTVLANEQVVEGKCDRSGDVVVQRDLEQWFFKITDFIEPTKSKSGKKISGLLSGLDKIDWPASTKLAQKNWIGKSEGAQVKFQISNFKFQNRSENPTGKSQKSKADFIEVFTTRLDTIFGCTYVVVAPEHEIIKNQKSKIKNLGEVEKYLAETKKKTDLERTELNKEKTGVKLEGVEVAHPFTGKRLPVFVADYCIATYGTGAVMGVPAHDERDFAFANKYILPIKTVILPQEKIETSPQKTLFTDDGVLAESGEFTGLTSDEARDKMAAWLKKEGLGEKKTNYKMRDWLISRQRYWGAPIPLVFCEHCAEKIKDQKSKIKNQFNRGELQNPGWIALPEKDLPVKLPTDVDFRPTGESPLVSSKSFHRVKCPKCGAKARRESDTMDTFVCSSWYYLRFADPNNSKSFASKAALKKYLPVDFYMGGAEHTVLHLLYARFFTKALMKYGHVNFDEPFLKLRHQGIILGEDGNKMSKSKGNVVNPDQIISEFGADSLRLYEMFMGPLDEMKAWNTASIIGLRRFLDRVWKLQARVMRYELRATDQKLESLLHKTIKKVTEDLQTLKFNTAISSLMILVNSLEKEAQVPMTHYQTLLILLSPFAPHIAEELWQQSGEKKSIFLAPWPKFDPRRIEDEMKTIAIQINGKTRATIVVSAEANEETVRRLAEADPKVRGHLGARAIQKAIYVPGRILNFVL